MLLVLGVAAYKSGFLNKLIIIKLKTLLFVVMDSQDPFASPSQLQAYIPPVSVQTVSILAGAAASLYAAAKANPTGAALCCERLCVLVTPFLVVVILAYMFWAWVADPIAEQLTRTNEHLHWIRYYVGQTVEKYDRYK